MNNYFHTIEQFLNKYKVHIRNFYIYAAILYSPFLLIFFVSILVLPTVSYTNPMGQFLLLTVLPEGSLLLSISKAKTGNVFWLLLGIPAFLYVLMFTGGIVLAFT